MVCRKSTTIGITVFAIMCIVCALLWVAYLKVLAGEMEILPSKTWSHSLPSGAWFEFTYQFVNHTGWGGDSDGITEVRFYPSTVADREYVGQLSYPLTPSLFNASTVIIHEYEDLVVFASSGKVFIRYGKWWSPFLFSNRSFPGQGNSILDKKIGDAPKREGFFKVIGVDISQHLLKVLYADGADSWILVYSILETAETLRLINVIPSNRKEY